MVNFYKRLLPSIACMLRPLTDELRGGMKGQDKLEWSVPVDADFALSRPCVLQQTWPILL
jgi:hypothetical protein